MKNVLIGLLIGTLIILIGTIVNYFCIPLYVDLGMIYPIILTDTIQNKLILCLLICEVPWLFVTLGAFIFSIIVMIGLYISLSMKKI